MTMCSRNELEIILKQMIEVYRSVYGSEIVKVVLFSPTISSGGKIPVAENAHIVESFSIGQSERVSYKIKKGTAASTSIS